MTKDGECSFASLVIDGFDSICSQTLNSYLSIMNSQYSQLFKIQQAFTKRCIIQNIRLQPF